MEVKDFDQEVLAASHKYPIVVDFWAPWCGPCRILGPVLEKLEREAKGQWHLAKVNTDEDPDLSLAWQVQGIPAVKMFHNGEMIAEFVGALPEVEVRRWLETYLPTATKEALQAAKAALAHGAAQEALALLRQAHKHEHQNTEVRVLLAEQTFAKSPNEAFALIQGIAEGDQFYDRAQAVRTLHRLLALKPEAEMASSPAWQQYAKGNEALRAAKYAAAFEAWIDVMMIDRKLDDDGARKACIALFTLLGNEHPLTQEYRRKFSSALY
ncbi:tetratricopeptide repeat protein [candidate division KSB1 bacterium]|nr:tetratricopeptide repeat protein [candidate division KSB1 bacterium]